MKKSSSKDAFGKAPPLPGDPNYGVGATSVLEKDTKEMEVQLQMLQMRMAQQAEDDASTPKPGGARWKSARTDRGSATRYARDVQEKHNKSVARREEKTRSRVAKQTASVMADMAGVMGGGDMQGLGGLSAGGNAAAMQQQQMMQMQAAMQLQQQMQQQQAQVQQQMIMQQPSAQSIGSQRLVAGSVRGAATAAQATQGRQTRVPPLSGGSSSLPAFQTTNIDQWSVSDVCDWLAHVNLQQYAPQFSENEINGPILLEVSLEDLDYMSIKALGHRKVLLKGIEDLRTNKRVTIAFSADDSPKKTRPAAQLQQQQGRAQGGHQPSVMEALQEPKYAPRVLDPALRARQEAEAAAAEAEAATVKKHWSQVEPLQEQQERRGVSGAAAADLHHNPGDGLLDEAEEKRLFQEAVAEWRGQSATGGAPKVTIMRDGKEVARKEKATAEPGMWMNPAGPSGDFMSDLLGPASDPAPAVQGGAGSGPALMAPVSDSDGSSLSLRELSMADRDEAAEAAAFKAAVAEWRGGGGSPVSVRGSSKSSNQEPASPAGTAVGTASTGDGTAAQRVADALAAQMEAESQSVAAEMAAKMEAIKARLAQAQAMPAAAPTAPAAAPAAASFDDSLDELAGDDDDDDDYYSDYARRAEAAARQRQQQATAAQAAKASMANSLNTAFVHGSAPVEYSSSNSGGSGGVLSSRAEPKAGYGGDSPMNSARSAASASSPVSARSGNGGLTLVSPRGGAPPVIEAVTTTLGLTDSEAGSEDFYVVEEDSDDD